VIYLYWVIQTHPTLVPFRRILIFYAVIGCLLLGIFIKSFKNIISVGSAAYCACTAFAVGHNFRVIEARLDSFVATSSNLSALK